MIELISPTRCTGGNICVAIAWQSDCQTCFLYEAHCPDDALYVAPDAEAVTGIAEEAVAAAGLFGSYRRVIGWSMGHRDNRSTDQTFRLLAPH